MDSDVPLQINPAGHRLPLVFAPNPGAVGAMLVSSCYFLSYLLTFPY